MRTPDISTTTFTTEITPWLRQIHSCLRPAIFLAKAIAVDGASALVHCDDGHDTTPILVSLAKIIMDPFYRTVDGWMCLVEEDWLQEGYRFGDADAVGIPGYSSQGTGNESPTLSSTISSAKTALTATFDSISSGINAMNVAHGGTPSMPSIPINTGANSAASFVLFLDCCHQLVTQFPLEFEYNLEMLMFTHQHSQASQFGRT